MDEKLAKYFAGELTEEECIEVINWRKESEENAQTFYEYKQILAESKNFEPKKSIPELLPDEKEETKVIPLWSKNWFKYAASIVVIFTLAFFTYQSLTPEVDPTGMTSYVKLDDGSKITLYKDAEILNVDINKENRVVEIQGKMYFDIKRDEDRPFIIYTNQAMIEVLGTSFVVDALKENTTEVIVESGLVAFSQNPKTYKRKVTKVNLTKGEKGTISPKAKGIIKQNNRNVNYLAWKDKLITFKQDKLYEAAEVIEEVYGYEVQFKNSSIQRCSLTAKYNKKSPEEVAKLISSTFDFTYQVTPDKKIVFNGEGCD